MKKVIYIFVASIFYYIIWQNFIYTPQDRVYQNSYTPKSVYKSFKTQYDQIDQKLNPIPKDQIFLTLQKLLTNDSNQTVLLNTKMSKLLKSKSQIENFSNKLEKTFNLPQEIIKKGLNENIIVWDWVNDIDNFQINKKEMDIYLTNN